jgi:hypothetical protein
MLRGMLSLRMRVECTICNRRRGGGGLMSDVLESGLVLELGRQHLLFY